MNRSVSFIFSIALALSIFSCSSLGEVKVKNDEISGKVFVFMELKISMEESKALVRTPNTWLEHHLEIKNDQLEKFYINATIHSFTSNGEVKNEGYVVIDGEKHEIKLTGSQPNKFYSMDGAGITIKNGTIDLNLSILDSFHKARSVTYRFYAGAEFITLKLDDSDLESLRKFASHFQE